MTDPQPQPIRNTPNTEPVNCGLCLYGSDVGVPGYDDRGPAYTNPACPDHAPETAPGVCTCGHTDRAAALTDREEAMLSFALEMAQEEIHARSLELADDDQAALAGLRRLADAASGPGRADGKTQQDETHAEQGTCGHRSSEGHPCTQPSGHLGYHRNSRHHSSEWTSWVGDTPATSTDTEECCGAEPPEGWPGDCWCTLPPEHPGDHQCTPCSNRHDAPGWTEQPAAVSQPGKEEA